MRRKQRRATCKTHSDRPTRENHRSFQHHPGPMGFGLDEKSTSSHRETRNPWRRARDRTRSRPTGFANQRASTPESRRSSSEHRSSSKHNRRDRFASRRSPRGESKPGTDPRSSRRATHPNKLPVCHAKCRSPRTKTSASEPTRPKSTPPRLRPARVSPRRIPQRAVSQPVISQPRTPESKPLWIPERRASHTAGKHPGRVHRRACPKLRPLGNEPATGRRARNVRPTLRAFAPTQPAVANPTCDDRSPTGIGRSLGAAGLDALQKRLVGSPDRIERAETLPEPDGKPRGLRCNPRRSLQHSQADRDPQVPQ